MLQIIELLKKMLGKSFDPELLMKLHQLQYDMEVQKQTLQMQQRQAQLQQKSSFIVPQQAGKTAMAQMMAGQAGYPPPGTIKQMQQHQPDPYKHQDIMMEYERWVAEMAEREPDPIETVMEFSLEED